MNQRIVIGHHQVIRTYPPGTQFEPVPVAGAPGDDLQVSDAEGKPLELIGWADWHWAGDEGAVVCAGPTPAPGAQSSVGCPHCFPSQS